jgi:hypothetical protein
MGYRKVGYLEQVWYMIKYAVVSWAEWQDAKAWAKDCRPAWLWLATKAKNEETRQKYKNEILKLYRGE